MKPQEEVLQVQYSKTWGLKHSVLVRGGTTAMRSNLTRPLISGWSHLTKITMWLTFSSWRQNKRSSGVLTGVTRAQSGPSWKWVFVAHFSSGWSPLGWWFQHHGQFIIHWSIDSYMTATGGLQRQTLTPAHSCLDPAWLQWLSSYVAVQVGRW